MKKSVSTILTESEKLARMSKRQRSPEDVQRSVEFHLSLIYYLRDKQNKQDQKQPEIIIQTSKLLSLFEQKPEELLQYSLQENFFRVKDISIHLFLTKIKPCRSLDSMSKEKSIKTSNFPIYSTVRMLMISQLSTAFSQRFKTNIQTRRNLLGKNLMKKSLTNSDFQNVSLRELSKNAPNIEDCLSGLKQRMSQVLQMVKDQYAHVIAFPQDKTLSNPDLFDLIFLEKDQQSKLINMFVIYITVNCSITDLKENASIIAKKWSDFTKDQFESEGIKLIPTFFAPSSQLTQLRLFTHQILEWKYPLKFLLRPVDKMKLGHNLLMLEDEVGIQSLFFLGFQRINATDTGLESKSD